MNFKPMLSADASRADLSQLPYPLLVSPKLDGLRCILWEGVAYSRNAKPFRNKFLQAWAADKHNLDGELIVGLATGGLVLERSKALTAFEGEPDFTFYLFDAIEGIAEDFATRRAHAASEHEGAPRISVVEHQHVAGATGLLAWEQHWLAAGYEGLMARLPQGPYKHGRSTMREAYLMKLKRFTDGEARVVKLVPARENLNPLQRDELGRAKRSSAAAGLVDKNMIGVLLCEDPKWGLISVAPGIMPHSERESLWARPRSILGRTIHWRCFGYGVKDAPRFARYYGVKEVV